MSGLYLRNRKNILIPVFKIRRRHSPELYREKHLLSTVLEGNTISTQKPTETILLFDERFFELTAHV